MKKTIQTLAFLALMTAFPLSALTVADLAGVYVGKRTETHPTFSERYDEIFVFEPDGRVTDYLYIDGIPEPLVFSGTIKVAEDGSFPAGEYGEGLLILRGQHLNLLVEYVFPPSPYFPEGYTITVQFRGHRTERALDLPPAPQ